MRATASTILRHISTRSNPSFVSTRTAWPQCIRRPCSYFATSRLIPNRFLDWPSTHNRSRPRPNSTFRRCYSSEESFPDPTRSDVFYHLFSSPSPVSPLPVYALSFLSTKPPSVNSCTIIGWLPAAAQREGQEAGLGDFKENSKFRVVLHEAISAGLKEGVDQVQINRAIQTHQGWMHIQDGRNIPALGRIGDPDDILATVLVEDGKILPETYQEMPSYRLCTADGLPQLTRGLTKKLMVVLAERAYLERNATSPS